MQTGRQRDGETGDMGEGRGSRRMFSLRLPVSRVPVLSSFSWFHSAGISDNDHCAHDPHSGCHSTNEGVGEASEGAATAGNATRDTHRHRSVSPRGYSCPAGAPRHRDSMAPQTGHRQPRNRPVAPSALSQLPQTHAYVFTSATRQFSRLIIRIVTLPTSRR